jgi:hypothetical protein
MPRILAVHGIAQQYVGSDTLRSAWLPALRDGLSRTGARLADDDLVCAFYGDLFRKRGTMSLRDPPYDWRDVDAAERELLEAWWYEAARLETEVAGPESVTMLRTPNVVQRALNALSNSRFFAGLGERAMIGALKQVLRYLTDDAVNTAVQERVMREVRDDTRVIVGHSLGSIVAYEALCAHPQWPVERFISLGSPLGMRNVVFDRLRPAPTAGLGAWPGGVGAWTNVADAGDVVALVKSLRPCFGDRVEDVLVHNGAQAHSVTRYLTAEETGRAIAPSL